MEERLRLTAAKKSAHSITFGEAPASPRPAYFSMPTCTRPHNGIINDQFSGYSGICAANRVKFHTALPKRSSILSIHFVAFAGQSYNTN